MSGISYSDDGKVRRIVMSNPQKRNALNERMIDDLMQVFSDSEADNSIRCLILTGEGSEAFSSGHDVDELLGDPDALSDPDRNAVFVYPARLKKPVIAAVNGAAYAGGFALALSSDIRIASPTARFAASGARLGMLPVAGQLSRLMRLMPFPMCGELLYTGAGLSAERAYQVGFVSRIASRDELLASAQSLGERIAANSPTAVAAIKQGLAVSMRDGVSAAEYFEMYMGRKVAGGPDLAEGITAFREKRSPEFEDR